MQEDRSTCVLTPIGKIQAKAREFTESYGQPGVMHTPVALLLDFYAGWTVPRHLFSDKGDYTGNTADRLYEIWGNRPYGSGDYLTHAVLSMLYPGYEDSITFIMSADF